MAGLFKSRCLASMQWQIQADHYCHVRVPKPCRWSVMRMGHHALMLCEQITSCRHPRLMHLILTYMH